MLNEAAVDDEAHKLGLGISDDALREVITSNPNFQDKSGAFDPSRFASALRDMDMNERGFVSELRKQALRQFIVAALATGVTAPKAEVDGGSRLSGPDALGRLFPPSRLRGGRHRRRPRTL